MFFRLVFVAKAQHINLKYENRKLYWRKGNIAKGENTSFFFYMNDVLITDISCYVIPISTFLESSRTGTSQCHCQKSSCWFRGMRSAHAPAFTRLSFRLQNYQVAKQRPWQCYLSSALSSMSVFPSDLSAAAHWTHPSSSSGGEGSWWHQQGQAYVPIAACKAFPSPDRSLCLLSPPFQLSPTVCLWVYGWLWGLPKYPWRNLEHKDQFRGSINALST